MNARARLADLEAKAAQDHGEQPEWVRRRLEAKAKSAGAFDYDKLARLLEAGFVMHVRPDFDGTPRARVLEWTTAYVRSSNNLCSFLDHEPMSDADLAEHAEHETDRVMAMDRAAWEACRDEWGR